MSLLLNGVRNRRLALVLMGAAGTSFGCSLLLDLDGYRLAPADAGAEAGTAPAVGAGAAQFDRFRFARGSALRFEVPEQRGVLANDGAGAMAQAGRFETHAGGQLELFAHGGFSYVPPAEPGLFWGDDYFEYRLLGNMARARVRLTVEPPALPLSELIAGGAGFGVAGETVAGLVGRDYNALAPAGDVNGDGLEDFVIGNRGPTDSDNPAYAAGSGAYVLFGKASTGEVSLAALGGDAPRGFAIVGDEREATLDDFGWAVAGAGDVNGDGLDDVLVSAPSMQTNEPQFAFGVVYVIFGKADGATVRSEELRSGLGGGFAIYAASAGYNGIGFGVNGAGDVNGDGLDDVVIGVPLFDEGHGASAGGGVVVFGKIGSAPVLVDEIAAGAAQGFPIFGNRAGELLGISVAGLGDVNGDGLDDVALGSERSEGVLSFGRSFVVFGSPGAATVSVSDLEAGSSRGFEIAGADLFDGAGRLWRAGDVNGDGLDDVLIAAPNASFGPPVSAPPLEVLDAGLDGGGEDGGDAGAGVPQVTPPPDLEAQPFTGIVYVVFGSRQPERVALRDLEREGGRGLAITTPTLNTGLGYAASSGDVNGDGLSDVIATTAVSGENGIAYLVLGRSETAPIILTPAAARAANALAIVGPPREYSCGTAASGSDVNGDGLDDLLVGSMLYPDAPQQAGGAYMAFGWDIDGALGDRDRALIGSSLDDVFELPDTPITIARGGNGVDTLRLSRAGADIDLTHRGRYESLEVIDVRGNGVQRVLLDETSLRRIPQNHSGFAFSLSRKLTVLGDEEDELHFAMSEYEERGGSAGRAVYARAGAYYGLELSTGMRVVDDAR